MSNFPIITNLADFKEKVGEVKGIEFKTNSQGYTVASYYILESDVFKNEYARECRGITFDPDGKVASRPFHKFFNLNENESTQEGNIDWSSVTSVLDKMDGSMITPVLMDGVVTFKTKRAFTSDEAIYANEQFGYLSHQYQFSKFMCKQGFTPIFELTSRANRIVCSYKEPALTLLAIRSNETGEYFSRMDLVILAESWEIPYVKSFINEYELSGLDWFKQSVKNDINKEGYVFHFSNGQMIKMKTAWYMTLHHVVTFTTERNVAEMVLSEQVDDFKAYIASIDEPDMLNTVNRIEHRVVSEINDIITEVDSILDLKEFDNPKDFAIKYRGHSLFYLLMNSFREKENNYKEFFLKTRLNTYTTHCI